MKYALTLTEEQLGCYIEALELYSRWSAGQLDHLPETWLHRPLSHGEAHEALLPFKALLHPDLVGYNQRGLNQPQGADPLQRAALVSYEMYREGYVRRYRTLRAKQRAAGEEPVLWSSYDGPTLKRTDQPLPQVAELSEYEVDLLRSIYLDPFGLYELLTAYPSEQAAAARDKLLAAGLIEKIEGPIAPRFVVTTPHVSR